MATTYAAADPHHYVWWFPGSPVKVRVDLRVIEGLQAQLQDTGHGTTEHGLLFGRVLEGATEILEFCPAFSRNVPEMIAELSAEPETRLLVGYYRTGETLGLNAEDLSLFQTFFGKPYHVFLVIQPNGFAPPNATFFFSQGNQKVSEFPFLEFPLDASLLATEERDRISRCRQAIDQPAVAPPFPPLPPAQSAEPRKWSRISPRIVLAMCATAALLFPALWFTNLPFRDHAARVWTALLGGTRQPQSPTSSPALPQTRIGLQVRKQAGDLSLTWDHESPAVTTATSGLISIVDGPVKRDIPLDVQQLRGESVLYTPSSDQVLVQLTVSTPAGALTESVRVIRSEPTRVYSAAAPKPQPPEDRSPVAQASKPFTAPPVTTKTAAPLPLNEPPAFTGNLERPVYPAASLVAPQTVAPPRPVPATTSSEAPVQAPAPTYYPPVPLREIAPAYPAELRALGSKPTLVAIRVAIDKNGKVLKAQPLPQQNAHQLFIMEAVRAAQLWKFQPARRGEEPVASESVLHFSFSQ